MIIVKSYVGLGNQPFQYELWQSIKLYQMASLNEDIVLTKLAIVIF